MYLEIGGVGVSGVAPGRPPGTVSLAAFHGKTEASCLDQDNVITTVVLNIVTP